MKLVNLLVAGSLLGACGEATYEVDGRADVMIYDQSGEVGVDAGADVLNGSFRDDLSLDLGETVCIEGLPLEHRGPEDSDGDRIADWDDEAMCCVGAVITRGDVASVVARVLGEAECDNLVETYILENGEIELADVSQYHPQREEGECALASGIMAADGTNNFYIDVAVNRGKVMLVMQDLFGLEGESCDLDDRFMDMQEDTYYGGAVEALYCSGVFPPIYRFRSEALADTCMLDIIMQRACEQGLVTAEDSNVCTEFGF